MRRPMRYTAGTVSAPNNADTMRDAATVCPSASIATATIVWYSSGWCHTPYLKGLVTQSSLSFRCTDWIANAASSPAMMYGWVSSQATRTISPAANRLPTANQVALSSCRLRPTRSRQRLAASVGTRPYTVSQIPQPHSSSRSQTVLTSACARHPV